MNKNIIIGIALLGATMTASASDNLCGQLNISIYNKSGHTCELEKYDLRGGKFVYGQAPQTIKNNEVASKFTISQDDTTAPRIVLKYICENKNFTIESSQPWCSIFGGSGSVSGIVQHSDNVQVSYTTKDGSYWYSTAGNIDWHIGG
ncbi:hypothetical protein [Legionella tucsonensis]|uniref:Secreted protein n=1 Tax=Legionella tucsonensis TaxID=40335 RepID=A0A0W0ZWE3_9GAMM|nr:hypothetical protein [Legionella tucsonensis]KTD73415.1 hypothetical protein Ltuc_1262 [Legionella tucsonensis]